MRPACVIADCHWHRLLGRAGNLHCRAPPGIGASTKQSTHKAMGCNASRAVWAHTVLHEIENGVKGFLVAGVAVPLVGEGAKLLLQLMHTCADISKDLKDAKEMNNWAHEYMIPLNALERRLDAPDKWAHNDELRESMRKSVEHVKTKVQNLIHVLEEMRAKSKYCATALKYWQMNTRLTSEFLEAKRAMREARNQLDHATLIDTNIMMDELKVTVNRIDRNLADAQASINQVRQNAPEPERITDFGAPASAVDEAIQLIEAGDPAAALVMLNSLPEQTAKVWAAKGMAHNAMNNVDAVIDSLQQAVDIDDTMSRVWFELGHALNIKNGRRPTPRGFAALERCIHFDSGHVEAHIHLGLAYIYLRNDSENAERLFKKATKLDSRNSSAYHNLAIICDNRLRRTYAEQDFLDAKRNYERARDLGSQAARSDLAQLIAHSEQQSFRSNRRSRGGRGRRARR